MAKSLRGKRPCSICRKWFQPDVRQKGRQKTCSNPACRRELHRRACQILNTKNRKDCKNDYLGKKLEMVEEQQSQAGQTNVVSPQLILSQSRRQPVLPDEIIAKEYGIKNWIVLQYLVYQIMTQTHGKSAGAT